MKYMKIKEDYKNGNTTAILLFYILGLLIMSVGSNLFLKATLGVAPSCTMSLTLSFSPLFTAMLYLIF